MDLRDALRTTGSVRSFTTDPVSDDDLAAVLDDARFAPSGGNRQGWRVAIVKDQALRRSLGDLMRPVWDEYVLIAGTGRTPFTAVEAGEYTLNAQGAGVVPNDLIEMIETVPAVLIVAVDLGKVSLMDKDLDRPAMVGGGSVYPFCWSILLAARERGLGGVITTFLSRAEPAAAPLLGLPNGHALCASIFLGHPVKQPTKLSRKPVSAFTTVDRFDGVVFDGVTFGG